VIKDGWRWMCSDDDFPIRQAHPIVLAWARFSLWACWGSFFTVKKVYISSYNEFTPNLMFYTHLGMR
jgi:hypothetical protein